MRQILVPVDFSEGSLNALDYAAEIALLSGGKLHLLYVYTPPAIGPEDFIDIPLQDHEAETLKRFKQIGTELKNKHDEKLRMDYNYAVGSVVEEITLFAEHHHVDLIVMGMAGTGKLQEKVIGNITTAIMEHARFPVLSLGKDVTFRSLKKIVLACRSEEDLKTSSMGLLHELAALFHSQIFLLNVIPELEHAAKTVHSTHREIDGFSYRIAQTSNPDPVTEIQDFAEEKKMDMIVMIPHRHGLLESLFSEPNTRKMAYRSQLPLLSLARKH